MLQNLELAKYNIKGKRYTTYFIIIIIIIIIIVVIYLFIYFIYFIFLSRSAQRIIIYNLFLWHKGRIFRVSRATAN